MLDTGVTAKSVTPPSVVPASHMAMLVPVPAVTAEFRHGAPVSGKITLVFVHLSLHWETWVETQLLTPACPGLAVAGTWGTKQWSAVSLHP